MDINVTRVVKVVINYRGNSIVFSYISGHFLPPLPLFKEQIDKARKQDKVALLDKANGKQESQLGWAGPICYHIPSSLE